MVLPRSCPACQPWPQGERWLPRTHEEKSECNFRARKAKTWTEHTQGWTCCFWVLVWEDVYTYENAWYADKDNFQRFLSFCLFMFCYKSVVRAWLPTPKGQCGLTDKRGIWGQGIWAVASVCKCTMKTCHNFSYWPGSYATAYEVIWVAEQWCLYFSTTNVGPEPCSDPEERDISEHQTPSVWF